MRQPLTDKQLKIYQYMRAHLAGWQCLPTVRDIAGRFGIASTNGVMAHLNALAKRGWIARAGKGKHGGWVLAGVKVQLVDEATPPG